ncbi:MAG: hypothetical protein K0S32_1378 [Bacteroidetes bacterium]|jgi:gliding motility-associated-like protein|nr:hypothetical protein [Bacteroidota bacterium]
MNFVFQKKNISRMKKIVIIWFAFLFFPLCNFATHIVGGELNYTYNGGSSYTIRLRLYRDCGPGTAGFPNSVSISVRGNMGATFSPGKDFNMSLASVANVPSNQPPCAVAPNPMPCVQVGTYSITVNNLPPNVGGYHLFYQVTARNLSLTNINSACNCIGESFYAYIPNNTVSSFNNSNAVFNALPPLFLCVNQPFTINHSASDANGDSLVYSLYTPYNGDNNAGPLDPTFPGNTAVFTPVNFLPGFTTTNPLGASPFFINSQTGVITGTPGMIGQFVVGIRVTEYRNGNYLSHTLRDFQFNVINCPQPPPTLAVLNMTLNNGCAKTVTAGGISQASANWTSVFPGATGAYNSYLACTAGCLSNTVTAYGTPPPFIDFKICGTSTNCAASNLCDTFRVYFNPTLSVSIVPSNPVLCFSQSSGTIMAIGAGGTPPYNYLWNNVNPSQIINVGNGTYNVALSDATGCPPVYKSVTVTSYTAPIVANAGPNITKCIQLPTAIINASVSGASGGIWSGGTGTFSPNNTTLNNLNYIPTPAEVVTGSVNLILTTTGNGSCPADSDTTTIFFSGFTGTVNASSTQVSCFNSINGSATVSIGGGVAPHQYTWTTVPIQTSSVATNLFPGIYTVTIKNNIGCTSNATVNITQPLPLNINSTVTNVSCFGSATGSLAVLAFGGTAPYTYTWLPGNQTTTSITNLAAGVYTLDVTDSKGCPAAAVYSVTQPASITISQTVSTVNCFGGNNGSVTTNVTGGTSPFTYTWLPGGITTPNATNLTAGTYTLIVKDNKSCVLTKTLVIAQSPALTLNTALTHETCNYLNNGSATVTAGGGSPAYTYSWIPGNFTSAVVSNLSSGTYTVTIKDSKLCSTSTVIAITQPPALTTGIINKVNVKCFGGSNGSVTANPSGGTPVYSYTWLPGMITTPTASNLIAGNYTLIVADSKSCITTVTTTISQPLALNVVANYTSVICNASSNGAISISGSGGVAPYTSTLLPGNISPPFTNLAAGNYTVFTADANGCIQSNTINISQPANFSSITSFTNSTCNLQNGAAGISITSGGAPPFTYSWMPSGGTGSLASNIGAGSYTVIVTDNNGCPSTHVVLINDANGPGVSIVTTTDVSCYGGSNGGATATFTGGTGPSFTYSWSPFGGNALTATNFSAGVYIITVVDNNGCIGLSMTKPITEPSPLQVTATSGNVSCFGSGDGSIGAIASGGTPGYSYLWLPGSFAGSSVTGLPSNVYTVQATDLNSCIQTATVQITEPPALAVLSSSITDVDCFGNSTGAASITVNGGTPNYSYTWLPSVSNGAGALGLSSGSYTVSVSDANGCNTFTTITINQPVSALAATAVSNSVSCFGSTNGSATVNVAGGTSSYSYSWSPNVSASNSVSALSPGNYNVIVTDINNCQTTVSFSITEPTIISGTLLPTNSSCGLPNGSIAALINGGAGSYSYTWTPANSSTPNISNLSPGTYSLQVADAMNCVMNFSVSLVDTPGPVTAISSFTNVMCYGYNNGAASVTINQGTLPYQITWSPYGGNTDFANGLVAGVYTVNVSDALGCQSTSTVQITEPTLLIVSALSVTNVSCFSGTNGAIQAIASGGVPAYTYSWSTTATTSGITGLIAGMYTVTIRDANQCRSSIAGIVSQPTALSSSIIGVANALCFTGSGSASVTAAGGTNPYYYLWNSSPLQTGNVLSNAPGGTYTVYIADANGCATTSSVIITQPTQVNTFVSLNDTICDLQNGILVANAGGGAGNYYYSWMPINITNSGTLTQSPSVSTTYTVMAFDQNGCAGNSVMSGIVVYNFDKTNLQVSGISPVCPGQVSLIGATISGNTGPVSYSWSHNLGASPGIHIVTPTVQTGYIVQVTNACGKTISDTMIVDVNSQPVISIKSDTTKICLPGKIQFNDFSVAGNPNDPITSWNWSFGNGQISNDSSPAYSYTTSGTYSVWLTVSTDAGCTSQNAGTPIVINVYNTPIANFNLNDTYFDLPFDKLICTNTSTGATQFNWTFGDGQSSTLIHPVYQYTTIGKQTVELVAKNDFGCRDTARAVIETNADIVFPNAFTPAHSDMGGFYNVLSLDNNVFHPYTSGVIKYKLQIFNRWGEMVFESEDVHYGWDGRYKGKISPVGVYIWKAYVELNNGKIFDKMGDLTLIR